MNELILSHPGGSAAPQSPPVLIKPLTKELINEGTH